MIHSASRHIQHLALLLLGHRRSTVLLLVVVGTVCLGGVQRSVFSEEASGEVRIDSHALQLAIDRSARYLIDACDDRGKFRYYANTGAPAADSPTYNVLRHAGTVYAMAQYCRHVHDPDALLAVKRAAEFLRRQCIATVADNPNFLAVWSEPELVGESSPRQAKLGGTALGLTALLSVEKLSPGFVPTDDLRKLGRFLVFMQKADGSFYSKFFPQTGRDDSWQSVYYPGEAALALILLHQHDPRAQWWHTATKALDNLAIRGRQQFPTVPDQWFLLAMNQRLDTAGRSGTDSVEDRLREHVRRVCEDMLREQRRQADRRLLAGCFTPEGRTCPTATRLEGLLAAYQVLAENEHALRSDIRHAAALGIAFLLDSQIAEAPYIGGFPRFKHGVDPGRVGDAERRRLHEIRIDYVQHALSAMLAYQQTFQPSRSLQTAD